MKRLGVVLAALAAVVAATTLVVITRSPVATTHGPAYYLVNDEPEVTDWRSRVQPLLVEALVQECMGALGHPYQALPLHENAAPEGALSPREWTSKYGFGATTFPEPVEIIEPDPNQTYVETLAPEEQAEYRLALFGNGTAQNPGCRGQAITRIIGPRQTLMEAVHEITGQLAEAQKRDPRIKAAEDHWAKCSQGAGLPTVRGEAQVVGYTKFAHQLEDLRQPSGQYDPAALIRLQAEEQRVALAIFECDAKFADETRSPIDELTATWSRANEKQLIGMRAELLNFDQDLASMARERGIADP